MATDKPAESPTLAVLKSIDQSLRSIVVYARQAAEAGAKAAAPVARPAPASRPAEAASDADLDGKYGDPEVRFTPRDWTGEPTKGLRMSQCDPDALDLLAEAYDYFAAKADEDGETTTSGKPTAPYKRKDAARARGWSARIRGGWRTKTAEAAGQVPFAGTGFTDEDIPFEVSR
jgi:hypothetical protein